MGRSRLQLQRRKTSQKPLKRPPATSLRAHLRSKNLLPPLRRAMIAATTLALATSLTAGVSHYSEKDVLAAIKTAVTNKNSRKYASLYGFLLTAFVETDA